MQSKQIFSFFDSSCWSNVETCNRSIDNDTTHWKKELNLFLLEKIIGLWKCSSLISTICHFSSVYPTKRRVLRIISTERGWIPPSSIKYRRNVLLSWNLVAIKFHLECFRKHSLCFLPAHFIGDVSISFLEISDLTRSYNCSS